MTFISRAGPKSPKITYIIIDVFSDGGSINTCMIGGFVVYIVAYSKATL